MSWEYVLYFIACIILANLLFVAGHYICSYIKWFIFLKDYQKITNRLDKDIILLKRGKIEEVQAREKTTEELVQKFFKKYPKINN